MSKRAGLDGIDFTGLAYLAAIGIGAAIAWQLYRTARAAAGAAPAVLQGAAAAAQAINPGNPENIINRAANAAVAAATGNSVDTIGTRIYNAVNGDEWAALNAPAPAASPLDSWTSGYDLQDNFAPPSFVGILPRDQERPAIIFRAPRRTQ